MTTIYVDNIAPNLQSKISAPNLTLPTGSVIQVKQTHKSDTLQTTTTSFANMGGLSVSITPSSASSKFLVMVRVSGMLWSFGHTYFRLLRDSTVIGNGDAAGNRTTCFSSTANSQSWQTSDHSIQYLDSPNTTSQITYTVQGKAEYGTLNVNRSNRDNDAAADQRTSSQITVMEIAG